jgi:transcription factor 1
MFQSYLDPLLNAPNSTYKLVSKDPLRLSSYRELVDEGAFPHQTRVDPKDPKAQEYNRTLLVTGSLVWDPRLPGIAFDSMAKQLFHHFASAAWSNDLFHAFGPVRTLLWVQSDDFNGQIAQSSSHMLKANRLLEMTNHINVVVGSERQERTAGRGAVVREPQHEIESTIHALKAGREKGLIIPEHRRGVTYDYATKVEKASGGSGIISTEAMYELMYNEYLAGNPPTPYAGKNLLYCLELEQKILKEWPAALTRPLLPYDDKTKKTGSVASDHPARELLMEHRKVRSRLWGTIRGKVRIEACADIQEEMYKLECTALKTKPGPKRDALVKKIEQLDEAWEKSLVGVESNMKGAPNNEFDDRINLRYPPHPRMQWDSRPFDPLLSYEDEAWPRNRLSLLSATPLPKPVGETDDYHELVQDFVHGLYSDPAKSVPDALNSMQHSLSDIIKDCPSLTNPDKGGRMLMKHLRVRMLTMEMVNELVKAYRDWPFKAQGSFDTTYFRHKGLPPSARQNSS